MGEVGCLQAFQTAADRSLTIVMTQTKGTHGFQLALFIVCSNGDCSVNIYLAKNASWCLALNPQQRETAITMMKFYQLRCNLWLCCYSSADFPIATRQCHDSKKKKKQAQNEKLKSMNIQNTSYSMHTILPEHLVKQHNSYSSKLPQFLAVRAFNLFSHFYWVILTLRVHTQNNWSWKGSLEIVLSNPPPQAESPTAGCPVQLLSISKGETPQCPWATWANVPSPTY